MRNGRTKLIQGMGLLLLLLFFPLCFPIKTYAAVPLITASADVQSAEAGGKIDVTVAVNGNTGISSTSMLLNYDNTVLKYVSCSWSSQVPDTDTVLAADQGSAVSLSLSSTQGYSEDGTLAVVHFEALESVSQMTFELQVTSMSMAEAAKLQEEETGTEEATTGETAAEDIETGNTEIEDTGADDWEDDEESWQDDTEEQNSQAEDLGNSGIKEAAGDTSKAGEADDSTLVEGKEAQAAVDEKKVVTVKSYSAAAKPASDVAAAKADKSYKTGIGFGNDIYLLLFAAFGLAALALLIRRVRKNS